MSTLRDRAQALLDEVVPTPAKKHSQFGEVYENQLQLELSPADLQVISSQEQMARVIAGLSDSVGDDMETEEEANDFDWPEPDPFSTPHTIRDVVEEQVSEPGAAVPAPPVIESSDVSSDSSTS